ncbi:MAG TPA: hypothetical protein VFN68_16615 [Acidimicrobiales bacterium]|nr:hypothetical protein [Acidimicrobiales bacterium]
MLVTSHVLAGALIGRALGRHPLGAFAAGVVSHFAMDACPHWGSAGVAMDEEFMRVARCDGCCGLAALAVAAGLSSKESRRAVAAAMIGGAVVDADKPLLHFFGWNPFPGPVRRFHQRIQNEAPHRLPYEVATAGVLGVLAVAVLGGGRLRGD